MNSKKTGGSYRDLLIWQKAVRVSVEIYALTKNFPTEERFALISQIQRATVSIAANIAEGYGRNSHKEFSYFLRVAHGSLTELETLLTIAQELSYCKKNECSTIEEQLREIGAMMFVLRTKLH